MKTFLSLLIFCSSAMAAHNVATGPWTALFWGNSGNYVGQSSTGSVAIPAVNKPNTAYLAFLVTNTPPVDLRNKTLNCSFTITTTGNPVFLWGGLVSGWNTCCLPAHTRFFLSTEKGYSNQIYTANENAVWWSAVYSELHQGASAISTSTADLTQWSNANGHRADESPTYAQAFLSAMQRIVESGLSFSGGSFYDCAVAVKSGTGTAVFTINQFAAN